MSDVAASGGYYIAMPAHAIVAEPATLTGSIGVVMLKFVIDGTLKKLGMNMEGVAQRPIRRSLFARARLHARGTRQGPGADAGDLRHVRREGGGRAQHDAAAHRRDRAGTRLDRRAGQADSGWSTNSAGSSARSRSPSSARRLRRTAKSRSSCIRGGSRSTTS